MSRNLVQEVQQVRDEKPSPRPAGELNRLKRRQFMAVVRRSITITASFSAWARAIVTDRVFHTHWLTSLVWIWRGYHAD